ncbi:VTC domain-containing protein [Dokdonia sinensis]|uniref:VTC domain-containing protein n=1 Tax=Dokdonia sinensis TaxID=2479847 RepID=A0A3M0G5M0_9FLAO|nr:VTC domain-containing protein [Dokdonia sinensis]RMB56399.1 VTC domain-containing protein [Dokdonia sinensis]
MERSTEKAAVKETSEIFQNLRYERKFIYTHKLPQDIIETEVLVNSFCFHEIFYRRTVNNIYYDDPSMSFYHQNVAGDDKRHKYRLRWYGDTFSKIENPILEIKKKMGAVGDKLSFKLDGFSHNLEYNSIASTENAILEKIAQINNPELLINLKQLSPALFNAYERRYFLSDCEKFRITIDYNMVFYNPDFKNKQASKATLQDVVLELKYKVEDDKEARKLTQQLTARLSKNSKYVRGVNLIQHHKET